MSELERSLGERVPHFSRGAITDEADGINRFARRTRGDDDPHAIKLS